MLQAIQNLIQTAIQVSAKSCIVFLGWKLPTHADVSRLKESCVAAFSHTSYWDFVLMVLFCIAYPEETKYMRVLVNQTTYQRWAPLLKRFGCLPGTRLEDRGKGGVQSTVEELKRMPKVQFLISPEGSLKANPWRSGYYAIAKQLNIPIRVLGFDYELKRLTISPLVFDAGRESRDTLEPQIQSEMGKIVPLYPSGSFVPIRRHLSHNVSRFDAIATSNFVACLLSSFAVLRHPDLSWALKLSSAATMLISTLYHASHECHYADADVAAVIVSTLLYLFEIGPTLGADLKGLTSLFFAGLAVLAYVRGRGRRNFVFRHACYTCWHPIFHLAGSAAISIPLII